MLREQRAERSLILPELQKLVDHASEDVRRKLRKIQEQSLDPFATTSDYDPARGYPGYLDYMTRKGYFGELLSGIFAITFGSHNIENWEIPALLFRFHMTAFQYLARQHQANPDADPDLDAIDEKPRIPGRTGDDCLAFQRATDGTIIRILCCEAKCSQSHHNNHIEDAHTKASEVYLKPVDLSQLIEILRDYDDDESIAWRKALAHFLFSSLPTGYERCDLVCYVYGQVARNQAPRIPTDKPHACYTANRRLEAVELYLEDVRSLVNDVYRPTERQES